MLKGSSKAVEHENQRELMHKGLSERDAVLVSLKNSAKDKKKAEKSSCAPCGPSMEDYPYGTRIELDDKLLEKLGIETLPEVGDEYTLTVVTKVKSVSDSSNDYGDGKESHRSMSLQIVKMSKLE